MIGATVEQSMQERYRGARERLGLAFTTKPVRVAIKRINPPAKPAIEDSGKAKVQTSWSMPAFSVAICQIGVTDNSIVEEGRISIDAKWPEIVRQVCDKHMVSPLEIKGRYRDPRIVRARHEIFYRLRTETTLSFPMIGRNVGGFDHSTCVSGFRKHAQRIADGTAL